MVCNKFLSLVRCQSCEGGRRIRFSLLLLFREIHLLTCLSRCTLSLCWFRDARIFGRNTSSRRTEFGPACLPDPLSEPLAAVRRVHGLYSVFFNGYIAAERTHKLRAAHAEERLPRGLGLHSLLGSIVVNIGNYVGCQTE
jgi:hypothetical protein